MKLQDIHVPLRPATPTPLLKIPQPHTMSSNTCCLMPTWTVLCVSCSGHQNAVNLSFEENGQYLWLTTRDSPPSTGTTNTTHTTYLPWCTAYTLVTVSFHVRFCHSQQILRADSHLSPSSPQTPPSYTVKTLTGSNIPVKVLR